MSITQKSILEEMVSTQEHNFALVSESITLSDNINSDNGMVRNSIP